MHRHSPIELTPSLVPQAPRFALEDLVLSAWTRDQVLRALAMRRHESLVFDTWGLGALPHFMHRCAINLHGPPGTGKTSLAHAMTHALGRELLCVRYSDIESRYVGDTPKNLVQVFDTARESDCVLFIDEADGLLGVRLSQVQNASDASVNVTRAALLALMNDFTGTVVFATNKLNAYDPAFMRRMLAHILVDLPDEAGREELLRRMLPPHLPHHADVPALAALSQGLSGGDLGNVVLNAALHAAERGLPEVPHAAFIDAVRQVRDARERNLAA